jgi:hypothetical protein
MNKDGLNEVELQKEVGKIIRRKTMVKPNLNVSNDNSREGSESQD